MARSASRIVALVFAFFVALCAMFSLSAHPALADDDGTKVTIIVMDESKSRVPDISITVSGGDTEDQTVVTDDSGMASVNLPAGSYTLTADEATLPDGAPGFVTNPMTLDVEGIPTTVRFDIGEPQAATESASASESAASSDSTDGTATTTDSEESEGGVSAGTSLGSQIMQKVISGLLFGLILALASIGVSLIYGTTGLNNFAHGEMVSFGGVVAYTATSVWMLSDWLGVIFALIFGALFGWLQDLSIWKPLRRKGVGLIPLMIVSIGFSLFMRYLFAFLWGPSRLMLNQSYDAMVTIFGVGLAAWNVWSALISIVLILAVAYALTYTKLGKATRAVADNKPLAAASGINVDRVIRIVWIGSGALAAVSGVLVAYYQTVSYLSGAQILLLIFAAVTLGGLGTTYGALFGSIILSLFIEFSTFVIPTSLKYVVAMLMMILILLVRPQGLLGKKQRVG